VGTVTTDVGRVEVSAGRPEREAARTRTAELFNNHRAVIGQICRGLLRDAEEAEDAAQQTFLSAYRALLAGAEPRDAGAWLATIARNECLQRIKVRMQQPLPVLGIEPADVRSDVHQQVMERLRADRLWREIAHLPPQQREAVVLRELAGLSYDDVAAALGITTSAVESLLFRARLRLRVRLRAVLAALDLGGVASGAAAALARLLTTGGAPLAVKAAAVGVGVTVVGGGGFVSERVLAPDTHHADVVTVSPRSRVAVTVSRPRVPPRRTTVRPVPVRVPPAVPAPVVVPVVEVHERQAPDHGEPAHAEGRPSPKAEREPVAVPDPVPEPVPVVVTTTRAGEGEAEPGATTTEQAPSPPPPSVAAPVVVAATTKSGEDGGLLGETTVSSASTTTVSTTTTTSTTTTSGSGDGGGHDGGHDESTTTGQTTTDGESGGSGKDRR